MPISMRMVVSSHGQWCGGPFLTSQSPPIAVFQTGRRSDVVSAVRMDLLQTQWASGGQARRTWTPWVPDTRVISKIDSIFVPGGVKRSNPLDLQIHPLLCRRCLVCLALKSVSCLSFASVKYASAISSIGSTLISQSAPHVTLRNVSVRAGEKQDKFFSRLNVGWSSQDQDREAELDLSPSSWPRSIHLSSSSSPPSPPPSLSSHSGDLGNSIRHLNPHLTINKAHHFLNR